MPDLEAKSLHDHQATWLARMTIGKCNENNFLGVNQLAQAE